MQRFFTIQPLLIFLALTIQVSRQQGTPISAAPYYPIVNTFLLNPRSSYFPLTCLTCSVFINTLENYIQNKGLNADEFILNNYCDLFGSDLKDTCNQIISANGPYLIDALKKSTNPDQVCKELKLCINPQCTLYPSDKLPTLSFSSNVVTLGEPITSFGPFYLYSLQDKDGDAFTPTITGAGGYNRKGLDCDDDDNNVYPGRNKHSSNKNTIDYNCNGISGKDPQSKKPYEQEFCKNTNQLGVIALGDSNTANFQIPGKWFDLSEWEKNPFDGMLDGIRSTFGFPQAGGFTGFCPDGGPQPCRSIYNYLYQRNRCNFRDYHNYGVNGAKITTLKTMLCAQNSLKRSRRNDYPALVFLELTINDICSPEMITPADFRKELRSVLFKLDSSLPAGSHLVIIGLIEDDIYERLHDKIHPSGVTFEKFYSFSRCLGTLACGSFLNPDKEQRDNRLQRAREFNNVYKNVLQKYHFKHIDAAYYDFPRDVIISRLEQEGIEAEKLYNQVDGFHLSQRYKAMLADYLWEKLQEDHPEWLGEINPNNDEIDSLFQQI